MFGFAFFSRVSGVSNVDQWLGNLFYRGCQPNDLMLMSHKQLEYWNEWHLTFEKAEKAAMNRKK